MDPTKAWSQLLQVTKGVALDINLLEAVKVIEAHEKRLTLKPFDLDRLIGSLLQRQDDEELLQLGLRRLQDIEQGMRRLSLQSNLTLVPVDTRIPATITLNLYVSLLKREPGLLFAEHGWFPWLKLLTAESEKLKYCRLLLRAVKSLCYEDEVRLWEEISKHCSDWKELLPLAPPRFAPFDRCPDALGFSFPMTAFKGNPLARLCLSLEVEDAHRYFVPVPQEHLAEVERAVLRSSAEWLPAYLVEHGLSDLACKWLHLKCKEGVSIPCVAVSCLSERGRAYCQAIATLCTQREHWSTAAHYWESVQQWERAACCHRHAGEDARCAHCLEQAIVCTDSPSAELLRRAMRAGVELESELTEEKAVLILQQEPGLLRVHPLYSAHARFCLGETDTVAGIAFQKPTVERFPQEAPSFNLQEISHPKTVQDWLDQLKCRMACLEHHCLLAMLHQWALDWPAAKQELKVARGLAESWGYSHLRQAMDVPSEACWECSVELKLEEIPSEDAQVDWDACRVEELEQKMPSFSWRQVLQLQALPFQRRRTLRGLAECDMPNCKVPLVCWRGGLCVYNPQFGLKLTIPFDMPAFKQQFDEIMSDNRASLAMGKRCQGDASVKRQWWEGRRALEAKMAAWIKELDCALGPLVAAFCFPGPEIAERRAALASLIQEEKMIAWLMTLPAVPKASLLDQLAALLLPVQLRSQAIKQLRMALLVEDDNIFAAHRSKRQLCIGRHLHWIPWEQLWPDLCLERVLLTGANEKELQGGLTYLLNPSGDLMHTQELFLERLSRHRGVVGRRPEATEMHDLVTTGNPFM